MGRFALAVMGIASFSLGASLPIQALILEQQVRRMIADPRSEALSTRFAAQWLRLQDVRGTL